MSVYMIITQCVTSLRKKSYDMIRVITTFGSLKIKRILLVTFIAAFVSGCFSARVLNANEAGMTIDYTNEVFWKLNEVYGKAQAHCQSYSKNSLLVMQTGLRYTFICK